MGYSIDTTKYIDKMISFLKNRGININLVQPKTIQDKLAWLNIYDVNPLKTKCADKLGVREYSKEVLGEDICIPVINVYDNTKQINWGELPQKFVIKCNHGSGMNIIVKDKSKLNKQDAIRRLNTWMNDDFAFRVGFEAHYHDIKHKIFVEEYMNDGHETLHDYKFWCFNGEPKLWTINNGNGHGDIMYYRMDGSEYNLYGVKHHNDYKKPVNFDKMVEYAKRLSEPFKFVRVDFYEINGEVYLGEMTFTPGACNFKYKNPIDNIKVGEMLKLGECDEYEIKETKFCIVHYNTPELTNALIKSINKFTLKPKIYIFDNSDKKPFTEKYDNVTVFDNTKGQIINFEEWMSKQEDINKELFKINKCASARHCYSIQKCMDLIDDEFILLDSDVLLKKDVSGICDSRYCCSGEVKMWKGVNRILPFICYINTKKCKENGIKYFDEKRMTGLVTNATYRYYDTGASFYEDIKKINSVNRINSIQYVTHYGSGSWNAPWSKSKSVSSWLNVNKGLWS